MKLVELSDKDKEDYNRFVQDCPNGSFLQSYEWGQWQESLGRQVFRFWILGENENKIASTQLIKMFLPFGKYYLYCPYGPVIGSGRLEIGDWRHVFNEIREKFSDAVFLRIQPTFDILNLKNLQKTANTQPTRTPVVNLEQTEDQLLANMHPKTRYNIRLAQKHGVNVLGELVVTPGHGLYFGEVVKQIVETAKRQHYKSHGILYYKNLIDFFALQTNSAIKIHAYKALYENQLLACGLMLDFDKTRTYLFGGSSSEKKNLMTPYLLHWQAMLDAKQSGFTDYDFWGLENLAGKEVGFGRFKLGFGSKVVEYGEACDFVIHPIEYSLYKILKIIKKAF